MRNSFVIQTYINFLIFTNLMFYKTINELSHKSFKLSRPTEIIRRLFFNSETMTFV